MSFKEHSEAAKFCFSLHRVKKKDLIKKDWIKTNVLRHRGSIMFLYMFCSQLHTWIKFMGCLLLLSFSQSCAKALFNVFACGSNSYEFPAVLGVLLEWHVRVSLMSFFLFACLFVKAEKLCFSSWAMPNSTRHWITSCLKITNSLAFCPLLDILFGKLQDPQITPPLRGAQTVYQHRCLVRITKLQKFSKSKNRTTNCSWCSNFWAI